VQLGKKKESIIRSMYNPLYYPTNVMEKCKTSTEQHEQFLKRKEIGFALLPAHNFGSNMNLLFFTL
jgi:hypothetical protein